ncbi:TetR/AcrR family transcriptional regulator [Streptomyces sp. H27-D2]|uniref:TetR/AcrR family transcriptional regulator n=1 Tax=Streptomyces sp. H27-D2 TaxID=3046304 RepID=UPI002DBBB62E|nr:TetR/AcrR family transcriptional regulator [Streptomyces sp. H27-D2]MEC4016537.1 TetR/AcrR family transcriptional regulator [Streptomyces sp. H27-D2]
MGHREDLLVGAKKCLYEKGYARTTARDIVAASGANLASIGYHYGSKEALLNKALIEAMSEWGEELAQAGSTSIDPDASPMDRFEGVWDQMIERFPHNRQIWAANFELMAQIDRLPEVREVLVKTQPEGRTGLAALFLGVDEDTLDEKTGQVAGSFYQALLLGVMMQHMLDPRTAPTGHDVVEGLRAAAEHTGLTGPGQDMSSTSPRLRPGVPPTG